jgi:SAM-dependent methyltransferase
MHQSSYEHMRVCIDEHLRADRHYRVLDFGSRQVVQGHVTHRDLLAGYDCEYSGVDVVAGPNVDIVMPAPYRIPLKSGSVDVVMTAQVFEHIPFPWASFLEIARVLRPGGLVFLIAPSRGHRHGTQDCWRYYPDSMRALAAFSGMELVEVFSDQLPRREGSRKSDYAAIGDRCSYWGDTVGVFQRPERPALLPRVLGEVVVRWANRVGGLEAAPAPPVDRRRRRRRWAASRGDTSAAQAHSGTEDASYAGDTDG